MIKKPPEYLWTPSYDYNVSADIDIPDIPVSYMLDETIKNYGSSPAFDFLGKKYNWNEIGAFVDKFAAGMQQSGIEKGDKVGLFLPNSPYFLISYYAILKCGATVVNLNPLYPARELSHLIEDSETDLIITADLAMLYDKMTEMLTDTRLKNLIVCQFTDILPFPKNILFSLFKGKDIAKIETSERVQWFHDVCKNNCAFSAPHIDPAHDIAVLQYTGGTTGVPKGAMLTHRNIYANTLQCVTWLPEVERGEQRMLGVLPFFHVFAMTAVMNFSVMAALEIVALPRFDLDDTLDLIQKKKPHIFPAVPAIFSAINNHKNVAAYDLSSLQYCVSGGAPLPAQVKRKFEEKTGCVVVEGYGLTEASPVVCVNPAKGENIAGSIGLPLPGTVVEIIDPEDKKTPKSLGERGELCITGPQVMKGYWNRQEASESVLKNGRLYTGDIAIMDDRGYFYIVDRIKDLIITNGYNVYPRNVEEAIYQHPSVEECIVAGLPDDKRGEIVKAWIKLKDGRELSEADLRAFLKDHLSPMEIPRKCEFRDAPLPKTMIGKLSRKDVLAEESV